MCVNSQIYWAHFLQRKWGLTKVDPSIIFKVTNGTNYLWKGINDFDVGKKPSINVAQAQNDLALDYLLSIGIS